MLSLYRAFVRHSMITILPAVCHFSAVPQMSARVKEIDLSLYLIADRATVSSEDEFFARIGTCVRGGVSCVQWRDPSADYDTAVATVRRLQNMLEQSDVSLVVNSRLDVAQDISAAAVFLEDKRASCSEARAFLGEQVVLSLPVETLEEVLAANEHNIDHISVKVFPSTCTSTGLVPLGLEKLREFRSLFHGRIIAVGGINLDNIEDVCRELRPGDGIALRGDLWRGNEALATAQKMRAIVDRISWRANE